MQINKKIINESSKNNDTRCQNILLDSGPWPYIDKYYKFVSQKEGSDTLYFECQMCLSRKKVVACTKKSRNGLKSHCNRFHSLISSEFNKKLSWVSTNSSYELFPSITFHSSNKTINILLFCRLQNCRLPCQKQNKLKYVLQWRLTHRSCSTPKYLRGSYKNYQQHLKT